MYLAWRMSLMPVLLCEWYFYLWRTNILIRRLFMISNLDPYIIYKLIRLHCGIISLRIIWNKTFNACVESRKYFSHKFTLVITIQTFSQQSSISYIFLIPHRHINPVSYHIIQISHFQANLCTVISRCIRPMCTIWYALTITDQMCVW